MSNYFPPTATAEKVQAFLEMYSSGLDFRKDEDVDRYIKAIARSCSGIQAFRSNILDETITLTRARWHEGINEPFVNIKNMKYPPVEKVRINRANMKGIPLFYCSDDPGTSIFEVRPEKVGDWVTTMSLIFPGKATSLLTLGTDLNDELYNKLSESERGIHSFLREKFRQKVDPSESHLYHLTIHFINMWMGEHHGVLYPSVASPNLKGRNIALRPDYVDGFGKFKMATIHEVTSMKTENNIEVKCIYRAYELESNGDFKWEKVTDCDGHAIDEDIYD